ncbi:hypothetical protein RchiOBHm_Chr5g0061371 [Rosa chinensis]|uniref:Uncharacterized protein n=1 Tax=Rosa chinensis TaxID=74649 RepID=A0A2P6QHX0_ROSCH|nr:hypothetical protein RchiOBHm_Chr5g0061371 [Rosa chinensis]
MDSCRCISPGISIVVSGLICGLGEWFCDWCVVFLFLLFLQLCKLFLTIFFWGFCNSFLASNGALLLAICEFGF